MIADLKPYAEYKESGLPWLGQVPGHWDERRLRSTTTQAITNGVGESAHAFRGDWPRYVRITDIADWRRLHRHTRASLPPSLAHGADVRKGDLLIAAVGATFGKAYVHLSDEPACCAGYLVRVRFDSALDPRFAGYWTESQHYWGQLRSNVIQSTIQNFSAARVKRLLVVVPPPDEQAAIVRFLDWANGRLERAIRAKRKVIALLNEQKQAIIHRAVTRGLDPSVPLKPSGIPWLGEIPAHWDLSPNRAHLRIRKVLVGQRHPQFQLLSLTKRGVIVRDLSEMRGKFSSDMGTSQEVRSGDLVFCLFDVPETPRTVGLSQHDGMITGAYTVMECSDLEVAKFLELFYIAMDDRKLLSPMYSGLRNTIPKDRFLGAKTPLPSAGERVAILRAVQQETSFLIQAISRLEREIDLLREYRTRLVADVVTGKLDVRQAAARLPDEEPLLATPDTGDSDPDDELAADEEVDA